MKKGNQEREYKELKHYREFKEFKGKLTCNRIR
jgi:hypothetical protein